MTRRKTGLTDNKQETGITITDNKQETDFTDNKQERDRYRRQVLTITTRRPV
ncbi:hypothetical protein DPMN_077999 [Dreissena polymorpha]|uniref:Uncharacterized protein n=1 Tax=Dreissena polymorpha TaxID=45954 RepID=A0A9D3YR06_DREPO|nr:hypothetical protein DPMN_077999 [Dreissena polymorpha]